jgi:hypothetical protein
MEGRLLLKGCRWWSGSPAPSTMTCVVDGTTIAQVAADDQVPALPGDWVVACDRRWVTPGLVDAGAAELSARALASRVLRGFTQVVAPRAAEADAQKIGVRLMSQLPAGRLALASGGVASLEPAWHDARQRGPDTLGRLFSGAEALQRGALADLVVWDLTGDLPRASELLAARAAWVVVAGRVVVREGRLVGTELLSLDDTLWFPTSTV